MSEQAPVPAHVELCPRRVRAIFGHRTVADSTRVRLVWENPYHPHYYFPVEDVDSGILVGTDQVERDAVLGDAVVYDVEVADLRARNAAWRHVDSPLEELRGLVRFDWHAMDHWYEEGEEIFVHPRDPYNRVEVLDSDRNVRVEVDGVELADSHRVRFVFETRMPVRYYIPPDDVGFDLLERSDTSTSCPYKGDTAYWNVTVSGATHSDVVWSYPTPVTAVTKLAGLMCFDSDKVDVFVDGKRQVGRAGRPEGTARTPDPSATPGHVEVTPKRVRVAFAGQTVVDSRDARWVWENTNFPEFYFPSDDIVAGELAPSGETSSHPLLGEAVHYDVVVDGQTAPNAAWRYPDSPIRAVRDLIRFDWKAMDRWYEESEEVYVDPRNPYARLDALESGRRVQVEIDGVVVADSVRAKFLFETRVVPRYYIPQDDVRLDLLSSTDRSTRCPFKGIARYWTAEVNGASHSNIVWSYKTPLPEVSGIAGHMCFYNEKVDIIIDGERQVRPQRKPK